MTGNVHKREMTDDILVAELFSLCMDEPRTIEELCNVLYDNMYAKNLVRVYLMVQVLLKRGLLIPSFTNDKEIKFKVDTKFIGGKNNE